MDNNQIEKLFDLFDHFNFNIKQIEQDIKTLENILRSHRNNYH